MEKESFSNGTIQQFNVVLPSILTRTKFVKLVQILLIKHRPLRRNVLEQVTVHSI